MADKYPWGSMAPAKRIEGLEKKLARITAKKDDLTASHKEKMSVLDGEEKSLKSDIRAAQNALEQEKLTEISSEAQRIIEKMIASGQGDRLEKAIKDGNFEKIVTEGVSNFEASGKKPKAPTDDKKDSEGAD